MNYFELFEFPIQLSIDKNNLKKKYLELSRRFHPDYFVQQNANAQQEALEKSALINRAYKTFSDADETIKYVLELKSLLQANEKYNLPPDFLMEMMELNEDLADIVPSPAIKEQAFENVTRIESELYQPIASIILNYKEGHTTEEELLAVKDYYFKKKYIARLKQQLTEKL